MKTRRFFIPVRSLNCAALSLCLAIFSGCSGSEVDLGTVEGTVMLDGKPLPDATVRFVPVGGGRSALGGTDENGHYEMLYSATAKGALVGKMRVEITTAKEVSEEGGTAHMTPELVPARYNTESELTVDVQPEGSVLDFNLESSE